MRGRVNQPAFCEPYAAGPKRARPTRIATPSLNQDTHPLILYEA